MENEAFYGDWEDIRTNEESGTNMTELESNFAEADEATYIEDREKKVVELPGVQIRTEDSRPPAEEAIQSERSLRERKLQRYQELEKARVPELLGKILTTEYTPKPRHKIEGELGKKGRRGL